MDPRNWLKIVFAGVSCALTLAAKEVVVEAENFTDPGPWQSVNEVLSFGMPFIRETPFGTMWISDKGGVFFCWHGVKDFKAVIPGNFVADRVFCDGKTTNHIPSVRRICAVIGKRAGNILFTVDFLCGKKYILSRHNG